MNQFVNNVVYASIGVLFGAYLITHVNFKVTPNQLEKYSNLCEKVKYFSVNFNGEILYVYCENGERKDIMVPEPK